MRKSWIAAFTIVALATLLIPATPFFTSKEKNVKPKAISYSATEEHKRKLNILQNDMNATSLLVTTDLSRDFQAAFDRTATDRNARITAMRTLMNNHAHLTSLSWTSGGSVLHQGSLPDSKLAKKYAAEAASRIKKNQNYQSPAFESSDGNRYIVMGFPNGSEPKSGIVGLVKQDIVQSVEKHQKRNLRLIPYPSEGNYRIESVHPNSTVDTTVKDGEDNGNTSHYHVKDAVVHFEQPPSEADLAKIKNDINAVKIQQIGDTYVFRSQTMDAEQMMAYFKNNWKTAYTEPHYLYMTNDANDAKSIIPNDVLYSQYQWNLPSIETEKGWTLSRGSEDVIIAVLDTGVQSNHPDLQGKLLTGTNIINDKAAPDDDVGHGTHVTGIIGANVNNGEGVAGLSWYNKIMPVKVLDNSGAGSTYSVAQGLIWAVDNGAKVINMSLGNYAEAEFLHDAIKYAYDHDVVLIAASGNDNTDRPGYPAAYPEVFAVAATTNNKQKASFSNYGDYIDVAAPGDSIASTYPDSQYAALSGTSMASPHVAALAGLIRSINPQLTNVEVMDIMRMSARDLGDSGKDVYFGYGEIDIDKALSAASSYGESLQTYPEQVKRKLNRL
ncbi:S8 family peptidase [Paenibacillus sp. HB172176]|uniref:S8 family peptidase n=1 Tax=Paenibacillus sp. HB172176 TaxID=2493690 RepID=UPI00143C0DD6|nr:S8 family peptidase [Paenibacillus sp. HB172176]